MREDTALDRLWGDMREGIGKVSQNPLRYVELANGYIKINKVRSIGSSNGDIQIIIKKGILANNPELSGLFRR